MCKGLIIDPDAIASDEATNEYNKESLAGKCGATIFHCFSPSNWIAVALKIRMKFEINMLTIHAYLFTCFTHEKRP